MITVHYFNPMLLGLTEQDRQPVRMMDEIRQADIASIRLFMESQKHLLKGRVLDFGAGKPGTCREPQPYRDLVSGEYLPYDIGDELPSSPFDVIMCNQVLQYLHSPFTQLVNFCSWLHLRGKLVMSYQCCWDEAEDTDYWRFTQAGMERMLDQIGFKVDLHERRAEVKLGNFRFPLGYGVVASKI